MNYRQHSNQTGDLTMPLSLDPDDEITAGEDLISLSEIRARIGTLKPFHVEDTRVPETAITDPTEQAFATEAEAISYRMSQPASERGHLEVVTWNDEAAELAALTALEAEMAPLGANTTAINQSYMRTVVADDTEGIAGADAIAILGEYVDWQRMTEDRQRQLTRTTYLGTTFFLEARG